MWLLKRSNIFHGFQKRSGNPPLKNKPPARKIYIVHCNEEYDTSKISEPGPESNIIFEYIYSGSVNGTDVIIGYTNAQYLHIDKFEFQMRIIHQKANIVCKVNAILQRNACLSIPLNSKNESNR